MGKIIQIPTYHISLGEAWLIVKERLDDNSIPIQTKVLAIEQVARMETMNSVRKEDLARALRWLFDHYDFQEE